MSSIAPSHAARAFCAEAVRLSPVTATRTATPQSLKSLAITKPSLPLLPGPHRINASLLAPTRQMIFAAAAPARSITSYSGTPLANRCCSAFRICSAVRMGAPDILLIRLRSNGGGEAIAIIGDCDVNHLVSGKGELRLFSSIGRNQQRQSEEHTSELQSLMRI